MTVDAGTVLVTGPTGGLGRAATLAMARRTGVGRPDLLLVGRSGRNLTGVAAEVRAAGAKAYEVPCDLSRLSEVRAAALSVRELLATGAVRPLRGLVANAGVSPKDNRSASAEGYELTFAVNYLAHAALIGDLLGSFTAPACIVLLGSNTYKADRAQQRRGVRPAEWRDPVDLARPAPADSPGGVRAAAVAYATSKLAVLYYAHELQRHAGDGIGVSVFDPGFMPGTGLSREHNRAIRTIMRLLRYVPGMAHPSHSGPALASVVLDERWAHLRDGAWVDIDTETEQPPFAHDRDRERRLWEATAELLEKAAPADT